MHRYDTHHTKHFEEIGKLREDAAVTRQQLKDHEDVDDERFGRIEEMNREIRDDVKELLKRVK